MVCVAIAMIFAVGCEMEGALLNRTSLDLYCGETYRLGNSGNCTWTSDNPLIASVEDGLVTANFIGTTLELHMYMLIAVLVRLMYFPKISLI